MRYFLFVLMIVWIKASFALSVTPTQAIVQAGQRLTLKATDIKGNPHWSVLKGGSIEGSGEMVTYIAPSKVGKDFVAVVDDNDVPVQVMIVIQPVPTQQTISPENSVWETFTNDGIQQILLSENRQILWVGTNRGLEQRNANTGELIKVITKREGLPGNNIKDLVDDHRGGLWVRTYTQDGDGAWPDFNHFAHLNALGQWKIYSDNNTIRTGYLSIISDEQGGLWIGTELDGLWHLSSTGEWSRHGLSELPSDQIASVLSDGHGGLWLGTYNGLVHWNMAQQWQIFNTNNSKLPENWISSLKSDGQDGLWITTHQREVLVHLNAAGEWDVYQQKNSEFPGSDTYSYHRIANSRWMGTSSGLAHLDNERWMLSDAINSQLPIDTIFGLISDGQDGLWGATKSGLAHLNINGISMLDDGSHSDFSGFFIPRSLVNDAQGGIWIGTSEAGLIHRNASGQLTYFNTTNSKLPSRFINKLLSDDQGGFWMATWDGLVHLSADMEWTIYNTSNSTLPGNIIDYLVSDNQGGLWFIYRPQERSFPRLAYRNATGQFKLIDLTDLDIPGNIRALASDNQGGVWLGISGLAGLGGSGGIAHYSVDGQWKTFTTYNSELPDKFIEVLESDGQDGVWIGTYKGGVAHLSNSGHWKIFNKTNSKLPDNNINALLRDNDGGLWIGFKKGSLAYLSSSEQITVFDESNSGMLNESTWTLLSDGNNGLWAGISGGLTHVTFNSKISACTQQNTSSQQCANLLTSKRAAIIIAGGGKHEGNQLWQTTNSISNFIYRTLNKHSGFDNDQIFYVTPEYYADFTGDGRNDHIADAPSPDHPITTDTIQQAFDWATQQGKLDQPLYLFFTDHGGPDKFLLSEDAALEAIVLNTMLDEYQKKTGNEIVIVIDACFSGELGKKLEAPKRGIITSTDNSYAFFNRLTYEGFSRFLSQGITKGMSLNEAFDYASKAQKTMLEKTDQRIAVTGDTSVNPKSVTQQPYKSENNLTQPLASLYLNGGITPGDATLSVNNKTPEAILSANKPIILNAEASVAQGKIQQVWAIIRPPRIDLLLDNNNTPILAFPRTQLYQVNGKDDQWYGTWNDTRYNGRYSVTFYAKDSDGDIISSDNNTVITVSNGIDPPTHATTQIQLNQYQFKAGDTLTAQVIEELNWGYDMYLAVVLPSGDFVTLDDKNHFKELNQAFPWKQGISRPQGQAQEFINLSLPDLPQGQYCLYALLSPERENVFLAQSYWKASQQCFRMQ